MAIFERGDIINLPLDPTLGHEQRGTRPALVLTTKEFNRLGDTLVALITPGRRVRQARRVRGHAYRHRLQDPRRCFGEKDQDA
jgi:mRNA-degrading endonuclease toxin of MazEF toxin-antitoxin module